ncbi:MAG TPA: hypothetical protein VMF14_23265 [Solirubrobacteraceae bacterium]|nr:hypothetical protein [Solirubrobacteraceae bacterium]
MQQENRNAPSLATPAQGLVKTAIFDPQVPKHAMYVTVDDDGAASITMAPDPEPQVLDVLRADYQFALASALATNAGVDAGPDGVKFAEATVGET